LCDRESSLSETQLIDLLLEVKQLTQGIDFPIVVVTANPNIAISVFDFMVICDEVEVLQMDLPESIFNKPASIYIADKIDRYNIVPVASVRNLRSESIGGQNVIFHPKNTVISNEKPPSDVPYVEGVVVDSYFKGPRYEVHVQVEPSEQPNLISFTKQKYVPKTKVWLSLGSDCYTIA